MTGVVSHATPAARSGASSHLAAQITLVPPAAQSSASKHVAHHHAPAGLKGLLSYSLWTELRLIARSSHMLAWHQDSCPHLSPAPPEISMLPCSPHAGPAEAALARCGAAQQLL